MKRSFPDLSSCPRSFPHLPNLLVGPTHFVHSSKDAGAQHFKLPQLCFFEDSGQDFVSLFTGIQRLYTLQNRWEGGTQESPLPCPSPGLATGACQEQQSLKGWEQEREMSLVLENISGLLEHNRP